MTDCIFCKIVDRIIPADIVYEDDMYLAFLDIAPVNAGHILIIPKAHYEDFRVAPAEISESLIRVIHALSPVVMEAVNAHAFNLTTNVGAYAGQVVPHLHWHLMPRFADDGYDLWHGKPYAPGQAQQIKEAIISRLS